ncbi:MAG: hypothetical protein J6J11_01045 [Treponema sp.]|nr:hypothetical protein [Clostridia bacterium]MBP3606887.1 hypothetical protein [Treponema sp.]
MGYQKLTKEQEQQLVQEYIEGTPVHVLMEKYGFKTKKSIADKVKKYGGENAIEEAKKNRKTYSIAFDGVTNQFNAYFLGLMLTDGYIIDENKFGIELTDEDCIQFLSEVTQKKYHTYEATGLGVKKRHRIIFSDRQSVKKLAEYGVVPNKTKILGKVPLSLEEEKFIPYIIRGIIDGDGSVFKTGYGAPAFYVCSASENFIYWLKQIFEEKLFFQDMSVSKSSKDLWRLDCANQRNILKLIALVYDKPYGMNRKYSLIREMFRDYNRDNLLLS